VVEAVATDRAAVSQPAADGVVVDGSAVVDAVVEALWTVDESVAVELAVVGITVDERRTVDGLVAVDDLVVGGAMELEWVNCTA